MKLPSIVRNKMVYFFVAIFSLVSSFLGFDSQHDGLILSNVSLLRLSMNHSGYWPFNQYGPTWAILDAVILKGIPQNYLLLGLRILTIGIYCLTAILVYRIMLRIINTREMAASAALFFASSQPFLSTYNSDFIPWPSALGMLITASITIILIRNSENQNSYSLIDLSGLAALTVLIIGTRAQIGVLILLSILGVLGSRRLIKASGSYLVLTSLFMAVGALILGAFGWLSDAAIDEFEYGFLYVSGAFSKSSPYPRPYLTFLAAIMIALTWKLFLINPKSKILALIRQTISGVVLPKRFRVFSICILSLTVLLGLFFDSQILIAYEIFFRRFLGALFLGTLGFEIFFRLPKLTKNIRTNSTNTESRIRFILIMVSIAAQAQSWPLFDQMHNWWGATPGLILIVLNLDEVFKKMGNPSFKILVTMKFLAIVLLVPIFIVTMHINDFHKSRTLKGILVSAQSRNAIDGAQGFFSRNMPAGARVLNLCSDSDVFFSNRFKSASRLFVFGSGELKISSMFKADLDSKPDYIVDCGSTRLSATVNTEENIAEQKLLISLARKRSLVASYTDAWQRPWRVWLVS